MDLDKKRSLHSLFRIKLKQTQSTQQIPTKQIIINTKNTLDQNQLPKTIKKSASQQIPKLNQTKKNVNRLKKINESSQ